MTEKTATELLEEVETKLRERRFGTAWHVGEYGDDGIQGVEVWRGEAGVRMNVRYDAYKISLSIPLEHAKNIIAAMTAVTWELDDDN